MTWRFNSQNEQAQLPETTLRASGNVAALGTFARNFAVPPLSELVNVTCTSTNLIVNSYLRVFSGTDTTTSGTELFSIGVSASMITVWTIPCKILLVDPYVTIVFYSNGGINNLTVSVTFRRNASVDASNWRRQNI